MWGGVCVGVYFYINIYKDPSLFRIDGGCII